MHVSAGARIHTHVYTHFIYDLSETSSESAHLTKSTLHALVKYFGASKN
jgi:hypothetical protein